MSGWKKSLTGYANETAIGKYKFVGKDLGKMSKSAVDSEYLSDVWTRINGTIVEQGINKKDIAKKCGFDRKILSSYSNLNLIYFARICEELNVSADFFLFGLDKAKEKTNKARYSPDKYYEEMPKQRDIIQTANRMMSYGGNNISPNNRCGISVQKELMTLADDFRLLKRKEVREIIETCKSYEEGQQKIMGVYTAAYLR